MAKKIFSFLIAFVLLFVLAGCPATGGDDNKPDDGGNNPSIDVENYDYKTPVTDELKLNASYEGKDFIKDGIGEVTVSQYIDGDTASFRLKSGGRNFTVRFQGINTPESTYKVEPWGYAASKYTKAKIKAASKIVLQAEDLDTRTDSNDRYLAWVWLIDENGDSRLLNLELCEMALAFSKANSTSLEQQFASAVYDVSIARCRIYGQKDPDYDYSKESKSLSIKQIKETYGNIEQLVKQEKKGEKVVVNGVVARRNGISSCYLQQYDEETNNFYGIYIYGGFSNRAEFDVGNSIVVECKIGYYFGSLQLTDVTDVKLRSWANPETAEDSVFVKQIDNIATITPTNFDLLGSLVEIKNVTVVGGKDTDDSNAFTLYCRDAANVKIDVRIDANIVINDETGARITSYQAFNGKTFASLKAIVSYYDYDNADGEGDVTSRYNGNIQLMLTRVVDYTFTE